MQSDFIGKRGILLMEVEKVLACPCHFLLQQRHHLDFASAEKHGNFKAFPGGNQDVFQRQANKIFSCPMLMPRELPEVSFRSFLAE